MNVGLRTRQNIVTDLRMQNTAGHGHPQTIDSNMDQNQTKKQPKWQIQCDYCNKIMFNVAKIVSDDDDEICMPFASQLPNPNLKCAFDSKIYHFT